jgi:hypothetical protein
MGDNFGVFFQPILVVIPLNKEKEKVLKIYLRQLPSFIKT